MARAESIAGRYYFALPRLWAFVSARDAQRGEQNWIEAYFGGVAVFLVSYATLLAECHATFASAIALLFVTWLGWLVTVYVNSLIVDALRHGGVFAGVPNARAQSVIITVETTICAIALTMHGRWSLLGWAWLLIVALNGAAAVVLRLVDHLNA